MGRGETHYNIMGSSSFLYLKAPSDNTRKKILSVEKKNIIMPVVQIIYDIFFFEGCHLLYYITTLKKHLFNAHKNFWIYILYIDVILIM
jgi:hypothetical protein